MASVGALRRLAASALALGRIRLELLSIEVQEEKQRLAALLFWAVLAALATGFALVFVAITATLWWWETHRLWVLSVATLAFGLVSAIGVFKLRALADSGSTLFRTSLAELRSDEAALRTSATPRADPKPPVQPAAAEARPPSA